MDSNLIKQVENKLVNALEKARINDERSEGYKLFELKSEIESVLLLIWQSKR